MENEEKETTISLAEHAYLRIRHEILICKLAPGEIISERELAERYEMSKTPIREALTQICRERLMQRLPGRGYMVSPITIKEIHEIFDLRLILEVAAVERAVQHLSPTHLKKLKDMSRVGYALDDLDSQVKFLEANRSFHLALAEATGNQRLVRTLKALLIEMDRLFYLGLRIRDSSEEMTEEHVEVVEALETGKVEAVRNVIINQIMTSKNRIMEAIMSGEIHHIQVSKSSSGY